MSWTRFLCWVPHCIHHQKALVGSLTKGAKELRDGGMVVLGDITEADGSLRSWENHKQRDLPERLEAAYEKLCVNLDVDGVTLFARDDVAHIFLMQGPIREGSTVWKAKVTRKEVKAIYLPDQVLPKVEQNFVVKASMIHRCDERPCMVDTPFERIIVGLPKTK